VVNDMRREMIKHNHPVEQEDLMAYLDGELPTDRAASTLAHLERCTECQTILSDLRGVSRKLLAWEVEASSLRIAQSISHALETSKSKPRRDIKIAPRRWRDQLDPRGWSARRWGIAAVSMAVIAVLMVESIPNTMRMDDLRVRGFSKQQAPAKAPVSRGRQFDKLEVATEPKSPQSANVDGRRVIDSGAAITGPMIVRTAALTLTTREFDKARARLDDILKRHHGYVGELNVTTPVGAGSTFTSTLRVPADQLEATLADLKGLGRVESESQNGQEVTAQYVDLEARLSNARNTEARLTDLLRQRTGKLSDVLAVETEIARVRGEIEQMEAEKKNLANQVTFATITATVREDYQAQLQVVPATTFGRLHNAAVEGYRDMVDGVVSTALFLLSYGPSLLLWGGILFFPARGVWRRLRRNPMQ
jgi:negative regulator of sigma E activity